MDIDVDRLLPVLYDAGLRNAPLERQLRFANVYIDKLSAKNPDSPPPGVRLISSGAEIGKCL